MHDPQAFAIKKGYVVKIYHSQYINEKKKTGICGTQSSETSFPKSEYIVEN